MFFLSAGVAQHALTHSWKPLIFDHNVVFDGTDLSGSQGVKVDCELVWPIKGALGQNAIAEDWKAAERFQ